MTRAARMTLLSVMVAVLPLAGCRTSGLQFRSDSAFDVVTPHENAMVALPFRVTWTPEGKPARYAVFFDRSPIAPGHTLLSLVPKLDPCRAQAVCPDATWLSARDIFVTSSTSVAVPALFDLTSGKRSTEAHEVIVVAIDAEGRRIGESAAIRNFRIERGSS
jgi:hypothetical protein